MKRVGKDAITGLVYDIQGFSVQDGPGIRTTVFLKGCPLRCPWCHSPESQNFKPQLCWMKMRCVGLQACGACMGVCPKNVLFPGDTVFSASRQENIQLPKVEKKNCDDCGHCASVCPADALYICGKEYTVEEITARIKKDFPFYQKSGGGVTISGGEALWQLEFTRKVLECCMDEGIHTALDTTGYAEWEDVKTVLPYTGLFLYDLKHMDTGLHRQVIGVGNEKILANAEQIAREGGKLQIRVPVIPNYNDNPENFQKLGNFCKGLGDGLTVIQLLPYHNLGVMKYERLMTGVKVLEAPPMPEEKVERLAEILKGMDLPVTIH
ncbi:MAG: glycyl-radical enzyme activating protein [Treponema sp.]|nr:glycyl-radical enzyme activating protein [Treponema sp.]